MIVGIDLGTTHTSIAIWENNRPFLIPDSFGRVIRQSVIGLDSSGNIIAGLAGEQSLPFAPVKRFMGKNKVFRLGKHAFRPEELGAFMIKSLISDGENYLKREIKGAVIAVPAHFNDVQRKSIRLAGELAGITVERLLNDPTAAALIYSAKNPWSSGKVLFLDLGGGTFDASIVDLSSGFIAVCSSCGDSTLGGGDFVDILESYILERIQQQYLIKWEHLPADIKEEWRCLVQKMVHTLTVNQEAFFFANYEGQNIKISITASQFEEISGPLIVRIINAINRLFGDSRLDSKDIDKAVLTGGASQMPIIAKALTQIFGIKTEFLFNPPCASSLGAAIAASWKEKNQNTPFIISDVCPYFLGIKIAEKRGEKGFRIFPLLERNTVVPTSRTDRYYTTSDYQTTFHIQIFQGVVDHSESHVIIGEALVLVPPKLAGQECIEVRCSYDVSGLLGVEVLALRTGKYKKFIANHQLHYL